ncbi:MAG: hypothetical protein GY797_40980 [Deltaproteobacteria bacterium]|nr:hypothetical protein [Deltaproteobacteria bacterium]
MKWKKIKTIAQLIIVIVMGSTTMCYATASVEWNVLKTLQLEAAPIDVAVSPDGKLIFVLTEQGQILIYSSGGPLKDKIEVGNHFDHIKVGPKGKNLILNSRKNKLVKVITLDFIQDINVSGSPFKGSEDAAVVVAVFDDFE